MQEFQNLWGKRHPFFHEKDPSSSLICDGWHQSNSGAKTLHGLEDIDPLARQKADLCIGMEAEQLRHLSGEAFFNEPEDQPTKSGPKW